MSDQGFGGFAQFLQSIRPGPGEMPDPVTRAKMARDKDPEPYDDDDRQAGMVARGYSPGLASHAAQELREAEDALEAQRTENANAAVRADQVRRLHEAGAISALDIPGRLGDGADADREAKLELRVNRARQRFAEVQAMITPAAQREPDPVAAAASRARDAHAEFVSTTRAKMAGTPQDRPQARRPFGSVSRGRSTEHTGADCWVCAERSKLEASRDAAATGAYERGSVITTGYREVYR